MLPGEPLASLMRSRYSEATTVGIGPTSTTLKPPVDDPPDGPRVKSQILPLASATRPVGPAAACASARVAKFSTRQKSGPGGSCATFFSTSPLTASVPEAATPTAG